MIIFTYGTLKKGFYNHYLLEKTPYLGTAKTEPKFTMLRMGGFPGIVAAGDTPITGELYEIDEKTLIRLDRLESHPNFYQRTPLTVDGDSGKVEVEAYLLPIEWLDKESRVVDSGTWTDTGD